MIHLTTGSALTKSLLGKDNNWLVSESTAGANLDARIYTKKSWYNSRCGRHTDNWIDYASTTNTITSVDSWFYPINDLRPWFATNTATTIYYVPHISKRELKRQKLREQLRPLVTHRALPNFSQAKDNEIVALNLLRQMVAPDVFRKYLKYGFVTVRGTLSDLVYQIQRSDHLIKVWDAGKSVCTLCVYLNDRDIPPTDEVIAKLLLCEFDERDLWKRARARWIGSLSEEKLVQVGATRKAPSDGFIRIGHQDLIVNQRAA